VKQCIRVAYNLTRPTCKGLVIHGCRLRQMAPERDRRLFLVLLFIGAFLHTCYRKGRRHISRRMLIAQYQNIDSVP